MEDKNKLFVFEKKEVFLIFLFIILIGVISFTLGVRVGKELSLKNDNYTQEDLEKINLKSVDEEYVEDVVSEGEESDFEASLDDKQENLESPSSNSSSSLDSDIENRLREEMEKLAKEKVEVPKKEDVEKPQTEDKEVETVVPDKELSVDSSGNDYTGKYTIQLFSHQSQEIAQDFADGFIVKGYDVIINEVIIPGKGKWYRVSIGAFDNMNQAKEYLEKEKELFQNKKYIIQQI
ncbi:MAG: SPOR domain-containing protein [Bacteriovoracaceae bacterium]|jgi:cell division protein FtsN|nr:hypothetical protein [Halobacteriovoraceae bacterium]MDP7319813.1 SPOR domain-containing protein [Bacteriovoracaceae bacterium]|tara:strand:- start:92 stop:796 length:705 start_codon:yes stop_codon:yes gene_type:complete